MGKHCESCVAPLENESDRYCQTCSDENGNLKSQDEVQQAIAFWFKSWQDGITDEQAAKRASHYMKAMPAWAED